MQRFFIISFLFFGIHTLVAQPADTLLIRIINDYEKHENAPSDAAWGDLTDTFFQQQLNFYQAITKRLATISKEDLNPQNRINQDLLQFLIADKIYHLEFKSYEMPLNAEGGFLTNLYYTVSGKRITNDEELIDYIEQLKTLPAYLNRRKVLMQRGQKRGVSSPQLVVKNCIQLIELFLETPISDNFYVQPAGSNKNYTKQIQSTVQQTIVSAYQSFLAFLKTEYLRKAPVPIGISAIENGKAFYRQRVNFFTSFAISPEEVFATGEREVARIRAEMEAIIEELAFAGSYADFLNFLRTDPQFYAKTGDELLKEAAWITKKMEGELPNYFGKLPRMPITVTPVDPAIAPTYTAGRYSSGSYHRHRAGQYLVNTYNLPSRPLYVLPALSLHEGVPGHHTQIMLAAEIENVPDFRRNTYLSAFGEGWALYCEFLGEEAGIYETPYERFGRLTYEMWRACRLVVDPGMHYMGWSREKAFNFMSENTALSIHEVNTEIDRYIGWPGQAVSYKMGELKIRALRQMAEQELGEQFDIRAFHDLILANGAVTMGVLEEIVKEWIQQKK